MHDVVVPLLIVADYTVQEVRNLVNAMVDDLNAVMQIGELIFLRLQASCQDVFQHLGDICDGGWLFPLLVLILLMLTAFVMRLLLRLLTLTQVLLLHLHVFPCIGVRCRDGEPRNLKGVWVFGAGCCDAKVVPFRKFNLQ